MKNESNAKICPVCGEENRCGMQKEGDSCWCFALVFSEPLRSTLKKDYLDEACICKNCFKKMNKEKND